MIGIDCASTCREALPWASASNESKGGLRAGYIDWTLCPIRRGRSRRDLLLPKTNRKLDKCSRLTAGPCPRASRERLGASRNNYG
jgi:hypothetical protein